MEPFLYYGLVACDTFTRLSRRVRVMLCATVVLAVAGGIMLQAATPRNSSLDGEIGLPISPTTKTEVAGETLTFRSDESTRARDGVVLTLRRSVRAPGTRAYTGELLPAGTITVVYQETGNEPHTLRNQGFAAHDELVQQIIGAHTGVASPRRKGRVFVDTLTGLGQTRSAYIRTGTPTTSPARFSSITYVAARIPNGEMYESYVDTGPDGFFVGFDAVLSGRMTMGPVADEHAARMREMFEVLSVPEVNLPVLAGAIVKVMNGAHRSRRAVESVNASGNSMRPDPPEAGLTADRAEESTPVSSSNPTGVMDGAPDRSDRAAITNRPDSGTEKSQQTPDPVRMASTLRSGVLDAALSPAIFAENAPYEPQDGQDGQPAVAVSEPTIETHETTSETQEASTDDASGVSGWWVVVALLGGMAGGGAASYSYWAREIELQAHQMARLRAAHREEDAARKVLSIRGMISDTSAETVAPEFELGDEFWESSTVKTRPVVNGKKPASHDAEDEAKDDTAWLDDLPF